MGLLNLILGASTAYAQDASAPLTVEVSVAQFVPEGLSGTINAASVGIFVPIEEGLHLGLRAGHGFSGTASLPDRDSSPWSIQVVAERRLGVSPRVDLFGTGAAGFVLVSGNADVPNITEPLVQLGGGVRLQAGGQDQRPSFFIAPQAGGVLGAPYDQGLLTVAAPYMGLHAGLEWP